MKIQQHLCDTCGAILEGLENEVDVHREHIRFRGQFTVEFWQDNEEGNEQKEWYFVTPDHHTELSFCDLKCLKKAMDKKKAEHQKRMEERIRRGEDPYGYAQP